MGLSVHMHLVSKYFLLESVKKSAVSTCNLTGEL